VSTVEFGGYHRDLAHPDFRRWIVTGPGAARRGPARPEALALPAPAVAQVLRYDGDDTDIDVEVLTCTTKGLVCVRQRVTDVRGAPSTWNARVEAAQVCRRP